jgi:hypothetical protein
LTELTGWKAKLYDVMRKLDKVPSGDKDKVLSHINDFNIIFEELDARIAKLRKECPVSWEPDKLEVDGALGQIRSNWKELWDKMPKNMSPYGVE